MNDPAYQTLLETSWRRALTPEEQAQLDAWLAARPEARAEWQADAALSGTLRRLSKAPLASNFTAQVRQAVEREQAGPSRRQAVSGWWQNWGRTFLPKLAWVGLAMVLGLGAMQQWRYLSRTQLANDLSKIPAVAALPAPEVLQDFDAIQLSSLATPAPSASAVVSDEALFQALQ